ncbi:formylglycine-generating enzyme family protein [Streptomyces sp. AJS327]|uniref:formylglycine-generating enzyme family protein n=1 Tax=Streptomyces sp. AJS327 TaxID=2545265 RepID=UPI0015DFF1DE|nr:formylglycine-generating enzyme family protein [Streptomyces sp. AJS327]MBA0053408.1 formylglycine-generating enzyme family protein [Streptomyces sp. AJS327]
MSGVTRWTGREAGLLRKAMRKTGKTFADLVGVNQRQIPRWERRGETLELSLVNQAALDTVLAQADRDAQQRFAALLTERAAVEHDERAEELLRRDSRASKHPVDGKLMALVEEGIYLSGAEGRSVWLESYRIDVYPTTNADYATFVQDTGHRPPQHWVGGRCPAGLATHPVVWVTWHDATVYARWAGKELPSAAQWEKAARGSKGRAYPWGNGPTAAKCNVAETGIDATTPVSRYQSGVSPYGVFDMCGNVWEWCSTEERRGSGRYELKGSAFTSPFERAAPSLQNTANATMQDNDTGFRCVSPP